MKCEDRHIQSMVPPGKGQIVGDHTPYVRCYAPGCNETEIASSAKRLALARWRKRDGKWYCHKHRNAS